ncbi:MAG: VOC family protein, partial [Thermoplasmata archaeon]|nr:VOC family protein [Thermoplasmata archaeon]
DAKRSAEWWARHFGFTSVTIGASGHAVMVAPPGDRFVLHLCEGFAPLEPGDTGIAFVTDELRALADRTMRAGVVFPVPPRPEEGSRMAKFADPDGNVFWLLNVPSAVVRSTRASHAPPPKHRTAPRPRRARKR